MINPVSAISCFTPCSYNINFRSNSDNNNSAFQYRLKPALVTDVFERVSSGGVNGSKNSILKAEKLFPLAKVQQLAPSTRETERNKRIEEEKKHLSKLVTQRTEYNTRQLRSAGVPEREIRKYLTMDGRVNDAGKRILREKGKSYQ